jgi:hypothetical protein
MCNDHAISPGQGPESDELLSALAKKLTPLGLGIAKTRQQHLWEILNHGRHFPWGGLRPGAPGECHQNAAKLWAEDPKANQLATGYALARLSLVDKNRPKSPAVWVVHSWVVRDERLIETTVWHEDYFGIVLPPTAAYRFFVEHVVARECPGSEESAAFLDQYAHLRPIAAEALRETVEGLGPEQLLDLLIVHLRQLGEQAPLLEQCQKLKETAGTLPPDLVAFLRAAVVQFHDLLVQLRAQPDKSQKGQCQPAGHLAHPGRECLGDSISEPAPAGPEGPRGQPEVRSLEELWLDSEALTEQRYDTLRTAGVTVVPIDE